MVQKHVAAEAGTQAPADPQWVVFVCDDQHYGFPLGLVREILTPRPFTRLPGTGPHVCGLIGVRGRVVTVVDLGLVLGGRAAVSLPDHRLLLLDLGTRRVGAAVEDVVTITSARIEPLQQDTTGTAPDGRAAAGGGPVPHVGDAVLGAGLIDTGRFLAVDPVALTQPLFV
jgi:chemotaxis signal transduction protein